MSRHTPYCVLIVSTPSDWQPANESSFPTNLQTVEFAHRGLQLQEALIIARAHNAERLAGGFDSKWALVFRDCGARPRPGQTLAGKYAQIVRGDAEGASEVLKELVEEREAERYVNEFNDAVAGSGAFAVAVPIRVTISKGGVA